jgi:D-sedoheptulose 7-phosphate isomerase
VTDWIGETVARHPLLRGCETDLRAALALLEATFARGGKLLLCGCGGSAADCDHITGELMKGFRLSRPLPADVRTAIGDVAGAEAGTRLSNGLQRGLPCISLTGSPALATAIANDMDPVLVFAQQTLVLGRPGDCLLGISTSGNAASVVAAFQVARALGLRTIAVTGREGGASAPLADVAVRVPADRTHEVQELHLPVYHALCLALEERFFGETVNQR